MSIRSYFQLLIDAFRLSRINNLVIIIITQYAGALFLLNQDQTTISVIKDFNLFILVLSTAIIAAAGYYINDYYDIKIDLINKPEKVIIGKSIRRRPVMMAHTTLNALGILLGAWVSLWIGLTNLACAVLLWLYSNQLKRMPLVGNLLVAFLTGFTLIVLLVYYRTTDLLTITYAFFAFGITLVREIIKDIEDIEGDANYGGKTLPVVVGIRRTKTILYFILIIIVASVSSFLVQIQQPYLLVYFGLMLIPFIHFIYLLVKADTKKHFTDLSSYCKWLIIAGVLSMVILKF